MTKLDTLKELLAKVEAGEVNDWRLYMRAFGIRPDDRHCHAQSAYNGSLDAAKALHEAVLPKNAYWWAESRPDGEKESGVFVGDIGKTFSSQADNPARAWLIAIIKALIAMETPEK